VACRREISLEGRAFVFLILFFFEKKGEIRKGQKTALFLASAKRLRDKENLAPWPRSLNMAKAHCLN
jgi:hypothetical protein